MYKVLLVEAVKMERQVIERSSTGQSSTVKGSHGTGVGRKVQYKQSLSYVKMGAKHRGSTLAVAL